MRVMTCGEQYPSVPTALSAATRSCAFRARPAFHGVAAHVELESES